MRILPNLSTVRRHGCAALDTALGLAVYTCVCAKLWWPRPLFIDIAGAAVAAITRVASSPIVLILASPPVKPLPLY